jgi:transcriptional regulator with XRE-family HTH domain
MVEKSVFTPRAVLARNLRNLMATKAGPRSQTALRKKSGVAQATIGRILKQETEAGVETVDRLAKAFGLEGWQMMVPGMDPTNPPVLMAATPAEKALYDRLRATVEDIANLKERQ